MKDSFDFHSFCPFRVCPLGAHIDHQGGLVTGFALDKGINFDFSATEDGSIEVRSLNFDGIAKGSVFDSFEKKVSWQDFLFGAVETLKLEYPVKYGIEGVLDGVFLGGGLSSSAAVILTYLRAFCKVNGIILTPPDLVRLAVYEERNFIGVNVGTLDQSCEVYCRKDNLLFLDTLDASSRLLPLNPAMKPFEIAVVVSGVERKLASSAYNTRVDECKAASYFLKDISGMEYGRFSETKLRDVPFEIFEQYKGRLPVHWQKRAEHFYGEMNRVKKGVEFWKNGDMEMFGRQIFESGDSSINMYEAGSEELKFLHSLMKQTDGIYGSRFSGAGFNGCAMALADPAKKEEIEFNLTEKYLKKFPHLKNRFSVQFCKTSDGVGIL